MPRLHSLMLAASLCAALSACAKPSKLAAAGCSTTIEQQNDVMRAAIVDRFGKQKYGYNIRLTVPRLTDSKGRIVLEAYQIYPIVLPEPPDPPAGRRLTVIMDPCTSKAIRVFAPRTS